MNFGERVTYMRKKRKLTQEDLAKTVGFSQQALEKIENGKTQRTKFISEIAKALDTTPDYLYHGVGNVEPYENNNHNHRSLPLISWIEAGSWHEAEDPFEPGDYENKFPCPARHGNYAYALRVKGDSMTSPYGRSYPEGMIIFVDPEQEAFSGDRVIAKVEGDNAVTFKQLVIDGDRKYLKPLNQSYPVITDPFKVIGKVIGAYMEE